MVGYLADPGRGRGLIYYAPSGLRQSGRIVGQPRLARQYIGHDAFKS